MPDEFKSVNITGNAATELTGGKKTRRTTKKKLEGGSDESIRGVSHIMNSVKGIESPSIASSSASSNSNSWLKYPAGAYVPPNINFSPEPSHIPSSAERLPIAQAQAGGVRHSDNKHIKVELKKKTIAKKVHLNPKRIEVPKSLKKNQTKKARKVSIGISSLHKRITRAKKLHKKVKDMPIELLKEKLIKGGLIKANSKAPESVLRQIATDIDVVKNKAL